MAREYKRRHLPIDVIVCDFFHWPRLGDYCFDPEFFPDPAAMLRELKEMSIERLVSVWLLVSQQCEDYPNMLQKGLLARAEYGDQIHGLQSPGSTPITRMSSANKPIKSCQRYTNSLHHSNPLLFTLCGQDYGQNMDKRPFWHKKGTPSFLREFRESQ